jgi:hypothetical protein
MVRASAQQPTWGTCVTPYAIHLKMAALIHRYKTVYLLEQFEEFCDKTEGNLRRDIRAGCS